MTEPKHPEPAPRGRGRPKAAEQGVSVMTWVKASEYDRLVKIANQREATVSSTVRSLLLRRIP